ncbi:MAG: ribose 5-phosphate isomerase B [Proteobacteria bacterium]|nr:ribose 5-phosphate isomerase B [Pseudomonadota bacterium]
MSLKIICGSDHAGFSLKEILKLKITKMGHEFVDCGTHSSEEPVDYPDYAGKVVEFLKQGTGDFGLLICGSGIGISIAANRSSGMRAALCYDVTSARLSRLHNDANILVLGERLIGAYTAEECLEAFLTTPFKGGERHQRRIDKLG